MKRVVPALRNRVVPALRNRVVRAAAHTPLATPVAEPPVLILGTARSGTSWIGVNLSEGPDTAYLREPVTARLIQEPHLGSLTVETITGSSELTTIADTAFSGRPAFHRGVVVRPGEWIGRTPRRLVIKEVQPLALTSFVQRYGPALVVVVRHPAGVLASWLDRRWDHIGPGNWSPALEPLRRFSDTTEQLGALFGLMERSVCTQLHDLGRRDDLVRYEQLARDPVREFRQLYARTGLTWTSDVEHRIAARSAGRYRGRDIDRTNKVSAQRVDRWRSKLDDSTLVRLRSGYEAAGGTIYLAQPWT